MKSKLLYLSLFILLNVATNYAQTSFSSAGIAVQGIARDDNNTALQSKPITLEFEFYYYESNSVIKTIGSVISKAVVTDNFGVFSTIIDPNFANNQLFSNNQVWLRIKKSGATSYISEAPLNHVPYAISANNGAPTGSIMPFMGTVAPEGWALCNGSPLPATATVLIAMVGANAPDLRGMFLRGAGGNSLTPTITTLGDTQDDAFKSHLHASGTLVNSTNGDHKHKTTFLNDNYDGGGSLADDDKIGLEDDARSGNLNNIKPALPTDVAGAHAHTISGSTALTGENETRPVNYGVNYIIKL